MKTIIILILKLRHEFLLDKFHESKYSLSKRKQYFLWQRVIKCRNVIRMLEPDFLRGCDY